MTSNNNLIKRKGRFYTKNLVPGAVVYDETLMKRKGIEYREWNPFKSKLGACMKKGIKNSITEDSHVLYLGAASGTTVSHVSDLTPKGAVYAVEFAPEPMRKLILLAKKRSNIIPIFDNANKPMNYKKWVERVDFLFQDVAQKNQVEIFTKNSQYLSKDGVGLLVIKSRSIDVTKNPTIVFKQVEQELRKKFLVITSKQLKPFEKDHKAYLVKKK